MKSYLLSTISRHYRLRRESTIRHIFYWLAVALTLLIVIGVGQALASPRFEINEPTGIGAIRSAPQDYHRGLYEIRRMEEMSNRLQDRQQGLEQKQQSLEWKMQNIEQKQQNIWNPYFWGILPACCRTDQ